MTQTVPVYNAATVREAERPLLEAGDPLMARAAAALAAIVQEFIDEIRSVALAAPPASVLVLAGSGDNGGDALFAASALQNARVDVLSTGAHIHAAGLGAAVAVGARTVDLPEVRDAAATYDLVLDGILGIGGSAGLRGIAREAVAALLPAVVTGHPRVIAVDLPSGVDPDTGEADEVVLPATVTVTFGALKAGLAGGRGPELAGDVVLADIGLSLDRAEAVGEASVDRVV
ncbi:hypothetical protein GCM10022200_01770 [Microbacterium awajiense]|uniref:NAD(P)H-hydrate epimerase n=1 Tax=Microbacterium awajiense TaxID=415214 RepID=A0ABP7A1P0_9MICO